MAYRTKTYIAGDWDGDKDAESLHQRTKMTEFFSTKIWKFNKTSGKGLNFLSGNLIRSMAVENNMTCTEIADSKITSNTIFILKSN